MKLIKNKLLLFPLLSILVVGMFLVDTNQAQAVGDAYFPQNTTVAVSAGDLTIIGGSDADTVTTNGDTVTVTISSAQSFTIESAGRKLLNNDGGFTYTCADDKSSLTITTSTTITVIISPSSTTCGSTSTGGSSGGGGGGGGGSTTTTPTPTPARTSTPASTPAPTSTPVSSPVVIGSTPASRGFTNLTSLSLKEGDVISATGSSDPDVYIVNAWGYKRLFLNPVIFGFYGHLGGFSKVKTTVAPVRYTLVTSGLFRNCETNDQKVYGVESTGEDTAMLHWVNTSGAQAVADDSDFFKKVFCINSREFGWYKQGAPYSSVNQIPVYTRTISGSNAPVSVVKKLKIVGSVPKVNVRDGGSLTAKIIGQVLPDEQYDFLTKNSSGWYNIKKGGVVWGWVFGQYVKEL